MFIIEEYDRERIPDAKKIQEKLLLKYGYELSIAEVIAFWNWVSYEHFSAGWLEMNDNELFEQVVDYMEDWISKNRVQVIEFKY